MYPIISLSVRPDGWDRNLMIEVELPDELPAKYLAGGRSQKTNIDTTEVLQAIADNGVHIRTICDVLHVDQKVSDLTFVDQEGDE